MIRVFKIYGELVRVLPKSARLFINAYSIVSGLFAIIDVAALGLLVIAMTSLVMGNSFSIPFIGELTGGSLMGFVGILCVVIVLKGIFSIFLVWFASRQFAKYELIIGNELFASYLTSPWSERLNKNSSDLVRIADLGIANSIAGYINPMSSILGEILTFISIVAVLVIAQPLIALIAVIYLGVMGLILYLVISPQQRIAGQVGYDLSLNVSRLLTEMVAALKEITIRNRSEEIQDVVKNKRKKLARARANMQFLSAVPRYFVETAVIGGFVIVGVAGYWIGGIEVAISSIALFSIAGFRLAPSITRFQAIISQANMNLPIAEAVVRDISEVHSASRVQSKDAANTGNFPEEPKKLILDNVSYRYPGSDKFAVQNISLEIPLGSTVGFVGSSGSGKTTLVDLILGLLEPSEGNISIDGTPIINIIDDWRKRIGYLPQDIALFDGTVAQNVALSWKDESLDEGKVLKAIERARILDTVLSRPQGINSAIGERGLTLSGGQRQRLGIARALYNEPLVLVMDEGTSALDNETEAEITESIQQLKGDLTVISVAHRLSTIMNSDVLYFFDEGKLAAKGNFKELVKKEPRFAAQAKLAGLV
ncbi:MAG: ABC transporter ATP-binding protein [Microbacteriaceae bacterium]|nr:ABC transporter ATP-binding protein [Microbacteriaceae bacterium]